MATVEQRIAQLRTESHAAGILAPTGPWVLEGGKSWDDMITLWEGPKGADFAAQDLPLMLEYIERIRSSQPMRILEVGGGYGKLAGMMLTECWGKHISVEYTMVDAVPESIAHTEQYMAGYAACTVVPAWEFVPAEYDMCINIASMQEMSQEQVDHYINMFDKHTVVGGVIFLMNSRDYHHRTFEYPRRWMLLHKDVMHRSLTPDYPLEVFTRCAHDVMGSNHHLELAYLKGTVKRYCGVWQDYHEMRRERNELARQRRSLVSRIWWAVGNWYARNRGW